MGEIMVWGCFHFRKPPYYSIVTMATEGTTSCRIRQASPVNSILLALSGPSRKVHIAVVGQPQTRAGGYPIFASWRSWASFWRFLEVQRSLEMAFGVLWILQEMPFGRGLWQVQAHQNPAFLCNPIPLPNITSDMVPQDEQVQYYTGDLRRVCSWKWEGD